MERMLLLFHIKNLSAPKLLAVTWWKIPRVLLESMQVIAASQYTVLNFLASVTLTDFSYMVWL